MEHHSTHLQQRFQITQGTDPVFRAVDGANCPSADVSTVEARSSAYSLLLNKGLIRMVIAGAFQCGLQHHFHHRSILVPRDHDQPACPLPAAAALH